MSSRRHVLVGIALSLVACGGGGGGGPTSPSTPSATPTPAPAGHAVNGFVYYDEDNDGALDAEEVIRIPAARLTIAGRSAQSTAGGRFTVDGVAEGTQEVQVDPSSLPSYFEPGVVVMTAVPRSDDVAVPVTLQIGRNRPNIYLAFGDSITAGAASSSGQGYLDWLTGQLGGYFGKADIEKTGSGGARSPQGVETLSQTLPTVRPAFTLIMYGTNDWLIPECRTRPPCDTIDALRAMIGLVKSVRSQPVLATIPPVNTAFTIQAPQSRQDWVTDINDLIRPMAAEQGAVLADVHAALLAAGPVETLFADHVHPNDEGYRIIAQAFFEALTDPGLRPASVPNPYRFGPTAPAGGSGDQE